jgi:hypothetical protein
MSAFLKDWRGRFDWKPRPSLLNLNARLDQSAPCSGREYLILNHTYVLAILGMDTNGRQAKIAIGAAPWAVVQSARWRAGRLEEWGAVIL